MAAVTKLRERWATEGARRCVKYKVTIGANGQTLQTPLHKIDYVDASSSTTQPIGMTIANGSPISAQQQITFQVVTTPDTVIVDVVGL